LKGLQPKIKSLGGREGGREREGETQRGREGERERESERERERERENGVDLVPRADQMVHQHVHLAGVSLQATQSYPGRTIFL